jgi:hypothetical protein
MLETNEVDDGQDLVASGTATAEAYLAAHEIAVVAAPFTQEVFAA